MKTVSKLKIIALLFVVVGVTFSCNEDEPILNTKINDVDLTTIGIIKGNPIFSSLVKAIEITDLTTTLKSAEPYTLLAPANDAFDAFLKTAKYATLNDVPKDVLKQILLNHVIKDAFVVKDFKRGYIKTLATSPTSGGNTLSMFVNVSNGVLFNGTSKIITPNSFTATNGVVHVVDKVIPLPTIVTHAQANPDFTTLVDNLTKTVTPSLVTLLAGAGPFTVFAPTNTAFTAFNTEIKGIASVSIPNLTKVLSYHAVNGNILAASLKEGQVVETLEPTSQTFEIQLAGGAKIKDARARISNISATDVQCANGVIHVLDKVLYPNL